MIAFDIAPLDERYADRQSSGDEFDADRRMRAELTLRELRAVNLCSLTDELDDDHADTSRH